MFLPEDPSSARPASLLALLMPSAVAAGMTGLIAAALFVAPASPLVIQRADTALGNGYPATAAATLMAVGQTSPSVTIQRQALERASQIHALELNQPGQARRALKLRLALGASPRQEARIRARMAELLLQEREVDQAADQFKRAWLANPERPALLARAAELQASIGNTGKARRLYRELLQADPAWADRANLGLGEVALHEGKPSAALRPFQKAIRAGTPEVAAAARLGLAACYERLGELEGALAQLDQADLPENVRKRREQALLKRADERE